METYLVWCPESGQEECDARNVTAFSVKHAAEYFAETYAGFNGDPFKEITVRVAIIAIERLFDVTVEVHAEPVFSASEMVEVHE